VLQLLGLYSIASNVLYSMSQNALALSTILSRVLGLCRFGPFAPQSPAQRLDSAGAKNDVGGMLFALMSALRAITAVTEGNHGDYITRLISKKDFK